MKLLFAPLNCFVHSFYWSFTCYYFDGITFAAMNPINSPFTLKFSKGWNILIATICYMQRFFTISFCL